MIVSVIKQSAQFSGASLLVVLSAIRGATMLELALLGAGIGLYGTLIGAGGGFVLMPLLLLLYPKESPEALTSVSLLVVFFNAFSGSVAYGRMKRIHYPSGLLFAAAGVPGAVIGALVTGLIPRVAFDTIFGVLMIAAAIFLAISPPPTEPAQLLSRAIVPRYSRTLGGVLSFFVGWLSSLLGIGGGILHVPIMSRVLKFPVHIATATSHFVLAILALAGATAHIVAGNLDSEGLQQVVPLSIGVIIGAQAGAAVSTRIRGLCILRALSLALTFVGVRILIQAFRQN